MQGISASTSLVASSFTNVSTADTEIFLFIEISLILHLATSSWMIYLNVSSSLHSVSNFNSILFSLFTLAIFDIKDFEVFMKLSLSS